MAWPWGGEGHGTWALPGLPPLPPLPPDGGMGRGGEGDLHTRRGGPGRQQRRSADPRPTARNPTPSAKNETATGGGGTSTISDLTTALTRTGSVSISSATERILADVSLPRSVPTGRVSARSPASKSTHARANCRRCCAQKRWSSRRSRSSCFACDLGSTVEILWRRSQWSSASSSAELSNKAGLSTSRSGPTSTAP
eukprot:scaffold10842_cov104-Isochrysis_galbana.AAC.2